LRAKNLKNDELKFEDDPEDIKELYEYLDDFHSRLKDIIENSEKIDPAKRKAK